jgi:hypothetical protein
LPDRRFSPAQEGPENPRGTLATAEHIAKRCSARLAARVLGLTAVALLVVAPSVQALVFREQTAIMAAVALFGVALLAYAVSRKKPLELREERAVVAIGLARRARRGCGRRSSAQFAGRGRRPLLLEPGSSSEAWG